MERMGKQNMNFSLIKQKIHTNSHFNQTKVTLCFSCYCEQREKRKVAKEKRETRVCIYVGLYIIYLGFNEQDFFHIHNVYIPFGYNTYMSKKKKSCSSTVLQKIRLAAASLSLACFLQNGGGRFLM